MWLNALLWVLASWAAVNLLHRLWTDLRRQRWERRIARSADGVAIGAEAYTVGTGSVAVLWIHGFADAPQLFGRLAAHVAATGPYACRVMRLPGAAEPLASAARQTAETWLAAVGLELDALRRTHERVWLAGHSLGATLALATALRRPDDVAGLVLLSPLLEVSRCRSPLLPPRVWFAVARMALAGSPVFESCFSANAVAEDEPAFTYHRDRFVPFATYRNLFALLRDLAPRASDLRMPVCAWLAEHDRVVDNVASRRWLAKVPAPCRVHLVQHAGHALPLERGWQAWADELVRFLAAHPAAS